MEVNKNKPNLLSFQAAQQARQSDLVGQPEIKINPSNQLTPVERRNQDYILSISQPLTMAEQQQSQPQQNMSNNNGIGLYQQIQKIN